MLQEINIYLLVWLTGDFLLICLLMPLRQGLFHTGGIDMLKFMPPGTGRHTQWQREVMHMRHCHKREPQ